MSIVATSTASGFTIFAHFKDLEDPRTERTKKHLLLDIIALAICAIISGADGWEDMRIISHLGKLPLKASNEITAIPELLTILDVQGR
jgi:hypothetical protein